MKVTVEHMAKGSSSITLLIFETGLSLKLSPLDTLEWLAFMPWTSSVRLGIQTQVVMFHVPRTQHMVHLPSPILFFILF